MSSKGFTFSATLALLAICFSVASCWGDEDCDRAGCARIAAPANGYTIETGIAGGGATESDVESNGCRECPFADGILRAYSTAYAIETEEDAQAMFDFGAFGETMEFHNYYEWDLLPGEYLICEGSDAATCAGVTLENGDVTTVHVKYLYGPTELIVFLPGETEPTTDRIFNVTIPQGG